MKRAIAAVMALGVAAGCVGGGQVGGGHQDPDEWALAAQEWRGAFYEAALEGRTNVLNFVADDIVIEDRIIGGEIRGWDDFLTHGRSLVGDLEVSHPGAMFVSAEGFLDEYYWHEFPITADLLDRVEMQGAVATVSVTGGSLSSGREYVPDLRDFREMERLADRYVALWNGGDEPGGLYADDARIEDTLLGLSAVGVDEIAPVLGSDAGLDPPTMRIPRLPDHREGHVDPPPPDRAIYLAPSDVDPALLDELRIVLEVDDGSGCPGPMAVSLEIDRGTVVVERRYHEIESVRRCRDLSTLQSGWWDGIQVPDPVRREQTDPMVWPERQITIDISNGNPQLTGLVRWGLEQFDAAGMSLPSIRSVTFLAEHSRCGTDLGFFVPGYEGADVTVCRTADQVCVDAACADWSPVGRHAMLHEYAHAWIIDNLDLDDQAAFLRFTGVERWNDHDDDWADRGVERAAETIAFGLLGQRQLGGLDGTATCGHVLDGFRLLTGQEPLTSCP